MKNLLMSAIIFCGVAGVAQEKTNFYFPNEEIAKVIDVYSKISGQKFIVDSLVRGKVSILNPNEITVEDAFNQLSETLALNGFAIIKNGDVYTVRNARSAQRDNVPVTTEVPAIKPQRLITWIVTLKHASADSIQKDLRMITSAYGEMSSNINTNQIIITDWSSNIHRISEMLKILDKPVDPSVAKIVAASKKERKEWAAQQQKNAKGKASGSNENEPEKEKSKN